MDLAAGSHSRHAYRFGPFALNARARTLSRNGRRLRLPGLPFEVLVALLEQAGEPVSRDALHKRLWPEGTFVDFDNNLNAAVARLRQTLGDSAERPRYVETVPRLGYRFIAPVDESPATGGGVADAPAESMAAGASGSAGNHPTAASSSTAWRFVGSRRLAWVGLTAVLTALGGMATMAEWPWPSRAARQSDAALDRGRDLLARGDVRAATVELQRAIALNQRNALAHSTLAHALHKTSPQSLVARPAGSSPALTEALRAVDLDPRCATCQGTLGFFLFYHDWQWARAERHLVDALRLDPGDAAIRPSYALLLVATGRAAEALAQIDRALETRPHDLMWLVIRASILYSARRYPEALAAADHVLSIDDRDRGALEWRSRTLFQMGRGDEAIQALSRSAFAPDAAALERAVRSDGAAAGLRALLSLTDDWNGRVEQSWRRAPWYMHLDDHERALDELERAYHYRNYNLMYIGVEPVYDPIRRHPRFQEILRAMGLDGVSGHPDR